jgi:recombination protein RecR
MSTGYPEILEKLMAAFATLPGIGPKSAERITLHILKESQSDARELARLITEAKEKTYFCDACHNLSNEKLCRICKDPGRERSVLCVVGNPKDVSSIEKTGSYHGLYHVLFGSLSPIEGIGPKELRLDVLLRRIRAEGISELILATNPDTEGDATALYLSEKLRSSGVRVTRIARGVPVGSHLEYVDQATLQQAMEGRTAFQ